MLVVLLLILIRINRAIFDVQNRFGTRVRILTTDIGAVVNTISGESSTIKIGTAEMEKSVWGIGCRAGFCILFEMMRAAGLCNHPIVYSIKSQNKKTNTVLPSCLASPEKQTSKASNRQHVSFSESNVILSEASAVDIDDNEDLFDSVLLEEVDFQDKGAGGKDEHLLIICSVNLMFIF